MKQEGEESSVPFQHHWSAVLTMMSSMVRRYWVQGVEHTRGQEDDHFGWDGVTVESVFAETVVVDREVYFDEDIWDESEDFSDLVAREQLLRPV